MVRVATYVANDGELSETFEYSEPDSDVVASFCDGSARLTDELVSIQSHLDPVVDQRRQRRQRKRRHEYCYEAELEHCNTVSVSTAALTLLLLIIIIILTCETCRS